MSTYLVIFKPREIVCLPLRKLLRTFHHKVDEVSAASKDAQDQKVCHNPEEPSEMNVLIFLVLLFIHDGFLQRGKISQCNRTKLQLLDTLNFLSFSITVTADSLKYNISCGYIVLWSAKTAIGEDVDISGSSMMNYSMYDC